MNAPRILSFADAPERHADRIVAQMIRFLIAERQRATPQIIEILTKSPDASPKQRLRVAAGSSIRKLMPGKRGRWRVDITDWTGWNDATDLSIEAPEQEIPAYPWLACWLMRLEGLGRHRYEEHSSTILLMRPHALSCSAQRCGLRTIDDAFSLMSRAWNACARSSTRRATAPSRTYLPQAGGCPWLRRRPCCAAIRACRVPWCSRPCGTATKA
jgi:hypothetical protein